MISTMSVIRSLVAGFLLTGSVPLLAQGPHVTTAAADAQTRLSEGEFIRATYAEALRRTHSPYASFRQGDGGVMMVQVERAGHALGFVFTWNFHEGDSLRFISGDGKTLAYDASEDFLQPIGIRIDSTNAFTLSGDKKLAGRFDRVDSFVDFLNRQTLAGTYEDRRGKRYVFGPDGTAEFPHRKFKYTVGTDHIGAPYDWVRVGEETWGYRISKNRLDFFQFSSTDSYRLAPRPFLSLSRIAH